MKKQAHRNNRAVTQATLKAALKRADQLGIKRLVVASTSGTTALALLDLLTHHRYVVCVTHSAGFREPGKNELTETVEGTLAEQGVPVLRTTHLFAGIDRAVRLKFGGIGPAEVIANTYRTLGEGTKVGVEIAVMALDAGLVPFGEDVIAIAGTGSGADTALVIRPAYSRHFFDTQVHEVIIKPRTGSHEDAKARSRVTNR